LIGQESFNLELDLPVVFESRKAILEREVGVLAGGSLPDGPPGGGEEDFVNLLVGGLDVELRHALGGLEIPGLEPVEEGERVGSAVFLRVLELRDFLMWLNLCWRLLLTGSMSCVSLVLTWVERCESPGLKSSFFFIII